MLKCEQCYGKLGDGFIKFDDEVYSISTFAKNCPYCGTTYGPLKARCNSRSGLSRDLILETRKLFNQSGIFVEYRDVYNLMSDDRLSSWQNRIQSSSNPMFLINALINTLHTQYNVRSENILVLFIRVLAENTDDEVLARNLHLLAIDYIKYLNS